MKAVRVVQRIYQPNIYSSPVLKCGQLNLI